MNARFSSMLATAIALGDGDDRARIAAWRQIVDIVAQAGASLGSDARTLAFARLSALRRSVPVAERRLTAASLAGLTADCDIVRLFADDEPGVAAPMLARARLSPGEWSALIPAMPPASRNVLRNRRDLPALAEVALAGFAVGDRALPASDTIPEQTAFEGGVSQIRDLVERIEAFRLRAPAPPDMAALPQAESFAFETTIDGVIDWIDGAPREPLIGASIAEAAPAGEAGVDGGVAGAWRRRAPFRDGRMIVAGTGSAGGGWLISGAPLFNPQDGRFCGYRGAARRAQPHEHALPIAVPAGTAIAADSLRQLVHELRTPLNAILGFAEMIDRQLLGPAASRYRERARAIVAEAERLIAGIDDLDTAARLDSGRLQVEDGAGTDLATLAQALVQAHRPALAARAVTLHLDVDDVLPPVVAPPVIVERMLGRLLAAIGGVAAPGERIAITVESAPRGAIYAVSRPGALDGREDRVLLDPGYGPDGDWPEAPLLGLGFTLRLVARLAAQCGGRFTIGPDRFAILLPHSKHAMDDRTG